MRVLHVVTSLEPGGMENGVVNVARELVPRGVEMEIACLERTGAFAERLPAGCGVRVLGKQDGFSPGAVARLGKLILASRPSVVHTHNLGPLIYAGLATLGGWTARVLQGEHSQLAPEELTPRRLEQRRRLYRGCRMVHTVSEATRAELVALGIAKGKLRMIPNGVDTVRFTPAARGGFGLPPDALVLGIVGRFGPFKGHVRLLEAFEALAEKEPRLHLLIAGRGGSEEEAVAARAKGSRFAERIRWVGYQAEPWRVYPALDLLVLPSTNEGMSNVALEAMACGVPVLANVGCGHEQAISSGTDGVITELRTAAAVAREISLLLAEPERLVNLGRRARATVAERFSLRTMAEAYESLYREVVMGRVPDPA